MLTSNPLGKVGCFAVLVALVIAAGCGGSPVIPHQTGNFSNASFKGSYVFAMRGFIATTGNPYRQVGVITADGNGNITGGVDDVNSVGTGGALQSTAAITGSYTVGNDGTGQIVLNSTALGATFGSSFGTTQMTLAVTLASSSNALLLEADAYADGAGSAELQQSTTIPSGTFVFGLHQDISAQTGGTASEVGAITISGSGLVGSMDQNPVSSSGTLTLTGTLTAPSSLGCGTATLSDSAGGSSLIYCIVTSGKFLVLDADSGGVGAGSAEAQSGSVSAGLSGTYAFGGRGDDNPNLGTGALAMVGQFTASGATISSGVFDAMQDGSPTLEQTFTGTANGATPNPSPKGRVEISLSVGVVRVFWLVSPSRAFFLDETSAATTLDGTADLQTSSSFSASSIKGQYALVMDGIDTTPEAVGRTGTMQFDGSSKITLVEVVNDSATGAGAQSAGTLGGNYQVGGSGRITTEITNNSGAGPDLVLYAISGTAAYALQVDSGVNTSGTIALQQ